MFPFNKGNCILVKGYITKRVVKNKPKKRMNIKVMKMFNKTDVREKMSLFLIVR